jgi:hypothetical protein
VHSQTVPAISQSRIATNFSMEAFGRDALTHDSHNYNNCTALSRSVANDSISLDSIGASTIVRITNRMASVNIGGPDFGAAPAIRQQSARRRTPVCRTLCSA